MSERTKVPYLRSVKAGESNEPPEIPPSTPASAPHSARRAELERTFLSTLKSIEARLDRVLNDRVLNERASDRPAKAQKEKVSDHALISAQEVRQALKTLEANVQEELRKFSAQYSARGDVAEDINRLLHKLEEQLSNERTRQRIKALRLRFSALDIDPYGYAPKIAERVQPLIDFLFKRYFRISVHGLHNVPKDGRVMLVANHAGALPWDGLMVANAVKTLHPQHREVRTLIEDFAFHFPYLGVWLNRLGQVRACPENAQRMLEEGRIIAVYPEGIKGVGKLFRDRYKLQRFGRGGFVKLALSTNTPIVPVAVIGAEESHPMLAKVTWLVRHLGVPYLPITPTFPFFGLLGLLPLPSRWSIVFGEPIDLSKQKKDAANDRVLVNHLSEQVRKKVQTLVNEQLEERHSVWFG